VTFETWSRVEFVVVDVVVVGQRHCSEILARGSTEGELVGLPAVKGAEGRVGLEAKSVSLHKEEYQLLEIQRARERGVVSTGKYKASCCCLEEPWRVADSTPLYKPNS
jgi:hypothetical protein